MLPEAGGMLPPFGLLASFLCTAIIAAGAFLHPLETQAEELQVRLFDGQELRGNFDPSSSATALVLKTGDNAITLRRHVDWERIERIQTGGRPVDVGQLRSNLPQQQPTPRTRKSRLTISSLQTGSHPSSTIQDVISEPRVTSISFDAGLLNWDADVETDGLVVDLTTFDGHGSLAAVNGTVEVELFVPQRRSLDLAPQSGGDTLELVERWTRPVRTEDFGHAGVRLRLPFGAIHPELRPDWVASHYGLVHVRLAAPGHGMFEASRDGVRVQPWAPNRDRLEMQTGSRLLWTERFGRAE
jgi:hypothetical protein